MKKLKTYYKVKVVKGPWVVVENVEDALEWFKNFVEEDFKLISVNRVKMTKERFDSLEEFTG